MKLYFQTNINKCGNRKQLIIDTETGAAERGYFLFSKSDAITVKAADLEKLAQIADDARRAKCQY